MRACLMCCAALAIAGGASAQSRDPQGYSPQAPSQQVAGDGTGAEGNGALPQPAAVPVKMASLGPVGALPRQAAATPPPPPAAEPAQADSGPKVAIGRRIINAAGAFDGYMHRAAKITANFSGSDSVARAVEMGSVYEPRQLEEGAIAYAALAALQDPAFVEAIREIGQDPAAREALVGRLVDHPESVLDTVAARRAATRVSAILGKIGMDMVAAGAAVKQASYDLQSQAWSKQALATPAQRLARIEAESSAPVTLAPSDTRQLISGLLALRSDAVQENEASAVTPVVARGLALAALAVLGMAGDDQEQQISPLLTEAKDAECIKMARLNDLQCMAVAGPQYEDIFCLGNHALIDSGRCIASAAGVSEMEMRPLMDQKSVYVPVAQLSPEKKFSPETQPAPEKIASNEATERNPAMESPDNGVAVPTAAAAPPPSYSPYSGPVQP